MGLKIICELEKWDSFDIGNLDSCLFTNMCLVSVMLKTIILETKALNMSQCPI